MAPRRARFYSWGNDERCKEVMKFITDAGILLDVRDMEKNPLTYHELDSMIGHLDIKHFLNSLSKSYSKNGLDKKLPARKELIDMMVADYTLIRQPIVRSTRLLTIGCDKKKISEMLGINANGTVQDRIPDNAGNRSSNRQRAGAR